ncbi:T9SS type A sorting domain-containing protein [Tunicatimonas pelagia]|uniref:T9SS type A sorting domain-containing protein n=1 Tax=Tunicatimonas pelagia TaxID=931531 RepID=UPI002665DF9C|nr:T9SS type A sorting domain-containing protein [Tunicatimonas pelagia]WKN46326.1 T9SS type A sorting domain-containing protein [Tunicatimonas pelagia]
MTPNDNLNNAINNASPGDVLLVQPGKYDRIDISNVNGTASNPIVIKSSDPGQLVRIDGNGQGKIGTIKNCRYLVFERIQFRDGDLGVEVFGSDHLIFKECQIINTGGFGLKMRNRSNSSVTDREDQSHHIDWLGGKVSETGQNNGGKFGEGIYVAQAQQAQDPTHNIWIEGAEISNTNGGEAVNIKAEAYRVMIKNCTIKNVEIYAVGGGQTNDCAIGVEAGNSGVHNAEVDSEVWVVGSTIDGVRSITGQPSRAGGILVYNNPGVRIKNNIIKNVQGRGIEGFGNDRDYTNYRFNNTFINTGLGNVSNSNQMILLNQDPGNPSFGPQTWYDDVDSDPNPGPTCGPVINWQNNSLATQDGNFTATWNMTPNGNNMDGALGLSDGAASAWSDLAITIRFNANGQLDARNGAAYAADASVNYQAGTTYAIRTEVDLASHTYDVFVTPDGGGEIPLATNFAFRTEQQNIPQLTHRVINTVSCDLTIANFAVSSNGGGPDPNPSDLSGTYFLENRDAGRRMQSPSGAGGDMFLGSATGSGDAYRFTLVAVAGEEDTYFIESVLTGFRLSPDGGSSQAGKVIEAYSGGGNRVKWKVFAAEADYFFLESKLSSGSNLLKMRNDNCADGQNTKVETHVGTGNCTQWKLIPTTNARIASGKSNKIVEKGELSNLAGVRLYPNPAHEALHLQLDGEYSYSIYDLHSQQLLQSGKGQNRTAINVSNFQPGLYILNIVIGSKELIKRKLMVK